jgi:succinoglycan biosynthesis protein ExoM
LLFFRQLRRRGGTIAFAANARVHEEIPRARLTLGFNVKRNFRRGNSLAYCELRLERGLRTYALRSAKGLFFIAAGALRLALLTVRRPRSSDSEIPRVNALCKVACGAGMLAGLAGSMHQAYRRSA